MSNGSEGSGGFELVQKFTVGSHRGRIGTPFAELHFEAGTFYDGTTVELKKAGRDRLKIDISPDPPDEDVEVMICMNVKEYTPYKDWLQGSAMPAAVAAETYMVHDDEWASAKLPISGFNDNGTASPSPDAVSGFVVISN